MKLAPLAARMGALAMTLAAAGAARAQAPAPTVPFNAGAAVRQGTESQQPPLPQAAPAPVLPQAPAAPPFTLKSGETLFVRSIALEGPALVDAAEVRRTLAPYENRNLTLAQIYEAAEKITTLYRSHGYLVAKAYVPAQDARNGVLRITVVPGRYGAIKIDNHSLVKSGFLQGVADQALPASSVIERDDIERAMLDIYDLPGAGLPHVAIGPGRTPETSDFVFDVPEGRRVDGYLLGDNYGSPFTGRDEATAAVNVNSPLGIGDRLSAFAIVSSAAGLANGRLTYGFPLGHGGLRGEIGAFRTTYTLGGAFQTLDATGTADGVSGTLTYPLRRQRAASLYLSGTVSHEWLNDEILNSSIAERTIDLGRAAVTGDTVGALAGLPLTTSTTVTFTAGEVNFANSAQEAVNIAGPATLGGYQKLDLAAEGTLALTTKLSLVADVKAQKSLSGNLDSSEQLSLTGYWGVRSYDEGLSGDSGYILTPELKYALPDLARYRHSIGLFTDVGAAWLENGAYTIAQKSDTRLNDVGVGYYGTYEYSSGRFLLLKAELAHSYGSNDEAGLYDRGTKALFQAGITF